MRKLGLNFPVSKRFSGILKPMDENRSMVNLITATSLAVSGLLANGCHKQDQQDKNQAPVLSASSFTLVATPPKEENKEVKDVQERILTKDLTKNAIESLAKILGTSPTTTDVPYAFCNPYGGFEIVKQGMLSRKTFTGPNYLSWKNNQREAIKSDVNLAKVKVVPEGEISRGLPEIIVIRNSNSLKSVLDNATKIVEIQEGNSLKAVDVVSVDLEIEFMQRPLTKLLDEKGIDRTEVQETLLYGLIPEESGYYNLSESSKKAMGVWQITEPACQDVKANIDNSLKCTKEERSDLDLSTIAAVGVMELNAKRINAAVESLENALELKNKGALFLPALITAYNAGAKRISNLMKWVETYKLEEVKGLLNRGELNEEDLFLYISIAYFDANKFHETKYGQFLDPYYGSDVMNYYPKVMAWKSLIKPEIERLAQLSEEVAIAKPPKASPPSFLSNTKNGKAAGLKVAIPETQLAANANNYVNVENSPVGNIKITSGFMEPKGHGLKKQPQKAIFENGEMKTIAPGHYNVGIDYVVLDTQKKVKVWYGGVISQICSPKEKKYCPIPGEGGFGNSITIKTNVQFNYKGKKYDVYQSYGHLQDFSKKLEVGKGVKQFDEVGTMGGSGAYLKRKTKEVKLNPSAYPEHVDLRTFIYLDGHKVEVSLNKLEKDLQKK